MPPARRFATSDRAGGGQNTGSECRADSRALDGPLRSADGRKPRSTPTSSNAPNHHRLEPRSLDVARPNHPEAVVCVRWQVHSRRCRGCLHIRGYGGSKRTGLPFVTGRQILGHEGGGKQPRLLSLARDHARVCRPQVARSWRGECGRTSLYRILRIKDSASRVARAPSARGGAPKWGPLEREHPLPSPQISPSTHTPTRRSTSH